MSQWVEGQRILVEGHFRKGGVPTDPTIVRLLARHPRGQIVALAYPAEPSETDRIDRIDTGHYEAIVTLDAPGLWHFRWEGSGVVDATSEFPLVVADSNVL